MTEELREKILFHICSTVNGDITTCDINFCNRCNFQMPCISQVPDEILTLIKEAGYVKLADDQPR